MKQKSQFTDQEKINLFDKIHADTLEEFNDSALGDERDEHYFWEYIMTSVLDIQKSDWTLHNKGHQF